MVHPGLLGLGGGGGGGAEEGGGLHIVKREKIRLVMSGRIRM